MLRFLTFVVILVVVQSVKLPPNFRKCNRSQPNLKQCVLEAAQHGVSQLTKPFPHLNIPSLAPLLVPELNIIKDGQGKVAVNQYFTDCKFYGFNNIKFDQFEFDFDKKTLQVKGVFPDITKSCHYKMDGKILLLPVKGEGPSTAVLKNVKTVCRLHYDEVKNNGKTYMKFTKSELDIEPDFVSFNFENLFNGDKALGDNVNKVLNENWRDVFHDVKDDHIQVVNKILLSLMNNFFAKVSIEEAFD
ncbi:protein takeout [Tribolium castaneum]|uniref:Protein takeout-like Protein n=1 Tax=Tribolium castaneum TaxID=7070 RepID=D2A487_TRICA|nr:PREDICTED: protein takeout [Tribolium castaneum]EFA04828.1 Protein takeout-like Protein [Tribolium castaneum]|eukprot:XP_970866.1 PREDICTED: protein takeout [Tribolium castaneum]